MSYCVNCGVELSPSEKKCPLCKTEVLNPRAQNNPDLLPPYPPYTVQNTGRVSRRSLTQLLTFIFLIPISLCIICDLSVNERVLWSGLAVGALALLYLFIALPLLLSAKKPRFKAVFCIIADAAGLLLYLMYVERWTGGAWVFPFALPVVAYLVFFFTLMVLRAKSPGVTRLSQAASSIYCLGGLSLLLEYLINRVFLSRTSFEWSLYPLAVFLLLATILVYIDRNAALKAKFFKKFFL